MPLTTAIETKRLFSLLGLPFDQFAGKAVVWLAQFVGAGLQRVEDRLIELDVELRCLRLSVGLFNLWHDRTAKPFNDPGAHERVVRQCTSIRHSLDASEHRRGQS